MRVICEGRWYNAASDLLCNRQRDKRHIAANPVFLPTTYRLECNAPPIERGHILLNSLRGGLEQGFGMTKQDRTIPSM